MPLARAPLPVRKKLLLSGFFLYAVLSLGSMATMSIGAAVLAAVILFTTDLGFSSRFSSGHSSSGFSSVLAPALGEKPMRWYLGSSLLLIAAIAMSLLLGAIAPATYGGHTSTVHFFKDIAKSWYFLWPVILVIGLRRLEPQERWQILHVWIGAFLLLSILGIAQYFTGWPRPQRIPGEAMHFHTTLFLGHHLSVASIFIFPFFAALDFGWNSPQKLQRKGPTFFYFLAAFCGLAALYFTYSRMLWVALPLGILIWVLWQVPKRWALFLATLMGGAGFGLYQLPHIHQRVHDALGVGTRFDLWTGNWQMFLDHPWFGVGFRHNHELVGYYLMDLLKTNDVFSGHAHNNFLDILAGTGIVGAGAWLLWCGVCVGLLFMNRPKSLFPYPSPSKIPAGWVCAWMVFHLNGLTQVNMWEAKVQHQLAWIIAWALL